MLDPAAIADKRRLRAEGHRAPLPPPHQDQPRGHQRDRRATGRTRPVPADPLPGHPAEERVFEELTATGSASRRRPGGHRASGACSRTRCSRRSSPRTRRSPRRRQNRAEERRGRAREQGARRAQAARRGDHRRRLSQARRPGGQAAGRSASARRSTVRAVVFSESVPTLKWLHDVLPKRLGLTKPGAGRHHARRASPTRSSRRSSSASAWRTSRCACCSPATWPPRASTCTASATT